MEAISKQPTERITHHRKHLTHLAIESEMRMAMLINIKVLERQYRESTHPIILCSDDDDDKENKFGNSLFAVEGTKLTNPIQSIVGIHGNRWHFHLNSFGCAFARCYNDDK